VLWVIFRICHDIHLAKQVLDPLTVNMTCSHTLSSSLVIRAVFVTICILLVTTVVRANPKSFSIQYVAENDYISAGTATWSMGKDSSGWVMRLSTSPSRLVRLAGVGKIMETTILSTPQPPFYAISYRYTDSKRKSKNYSASPSETTDEIVIVRSDKTLSVPADDAVVIDRLSATLTVAAELTQNPAFQTLQFKVFDRNGIRDMEFKNRGKETIRLGSKSFDAYIVESGRPNSSRKTKTWFGLVGDSAAAQRLLPVKIEQFKNNELVLRLSLTKYKLH